MTQSEALSILKTGANVFLTGEPGSGKTHTVNLYIEHLRKHKISVAVTASTGIAATHLGGMTIHSWSGIGIRKELSRHNLDRLRDKKRLVNRAQRTSVVVIDEISMLDAKVLSAVESALRALRESEKSFGGVQIVLVGDFFQLPPVSQKSADVEFAFESPAWSDAQPTVCYLTEQYRQDDSQFTSFLKSIRSGSSSSPNHPALLSRKVKVDVEKTTTRLYSHNIDVDNVNAEKLKKLKGGEHVFQMTSRGKKSFVNQLKKGCLSPENLILKKAAQVMFTKNNFEEGFVNGTLGKVVGFKNELPHVLTKQGRKILVSPMEWIIEENGKTVAGITQIPLRLAWAITVHKSQGMSLDAAVIDLSKAFEYGQGYVAISRVKSLSGLYLLGINKKALEVHPKIVKVDSHFRKQSQKALCTLGGFPQTKLAKIHKDFILKSGGSLKKTRTAPARSTYDETLSLYNDGKSIAQITKARGLKEGTIVNHLEKLKSEERLTPNELTRIIPEGLVSKLPEVHKAFSDSEDERLSPVFNKLNGKYSYDELRLARLVLYLKIQT